MKKYTLFAVALLIGLIAWKLGGSMVEATLQNKKVKEQIATFKEGQQITLDQLFPFEWDEFYSFEPYTSKTQVEDTLGFPFDAYRSTVNEGTVFVILTKGKEVIYYASGYADFYHYYFVNQDFQHVSMKDQQPFVIEQIEKDTIHLKIDEKKN